MTEQEKYVREHWEWSELGGFGFRVAFYVDGAMRFSTPVFGNPVEAWSAAADFTRQRLEEIRQVEREIEWLTPYASGTTYSDEFHPSHLAELVRLDCAPYRIMEVEQARLAELQRGMKEQR